MSRQEKAVQRLLARPNDFAWGELKTVMQSFGYELTTVGGSGRKFVRQGSKSFMVHEPHPQKILKAYQIRALIEFLRVQGDIQ